jgi:hypothetical protein
MHDIRELLEIGKGDAPPPPYAVDDLVASGQRRRRRRLAQRIGGAGVVAVGLAVSGVLVASTITVSANRPAAPPPKVEVGQAAPVVAIAPFTFMFDTYSVGGFRVLPPQVVTATYQEASIVADYQDPNGKATTAYVGMLTLYRPGVRPPAEFTVGTKVTVHGQSGFANEREQDAVTAINGGGVFTNPTGTMADTLAWQYANNSWAVINSVIELPSDLSHRLTAPDERALADAFSLGAPSRARIPFQAGHLPAGWQVVSVSGRSFTAEDIGSVTVVFAPASPQATTKVRHFANAADGPAVVVTIIHADAPPPDAPKTKTTCGHFETDTDRACSWAIPNTQYAYVLRDPANTLSEAELTAIGQSLTFDNLDQPDTWHQIP